MKRKTIWNILIGLVIFIVLALMIAPAIFVKLADPERVFSPPSLEERAEVPDLEFQLLDLSGGDTLEFHSAKAGKQQIIYFWTENCHPCPPELRLLEKFRKETEERIDIWAISIDKAPDRAGRFAELYQDNIPLYYRIEGDLPEGLSRTKTPQSLYIDGKGNAYWQKIPVNWADEAFLEEVTDGQ
ncbi:MAG: redoxin domain-containing protein [Bacteroidetes bacterium]|nr:redoxin domain-containing protein [Bacteroidota bacterium]